MTDNRLLPDRPRASRRAGMTLTELMVAMMVMTVSVYLLSSTITATIGHSISKRERLLAAEAARSLLEEMRALPCADLFALYNADPSDDPDGAGTAPGKHFDVPGLAPLPTDADGFVGEIILPADQAPLNENIVNEELGFPRDISGDALIDGHDHAADYVALPIKVVLNWSGRMGEREFEIYTIFADIRKWRE